MTHCCIPGCHYASNRSSEKRSLFRILRPDLAKSEEERLHREDLTKYILSVRDATKGDVIKTLLHKEVAAICENHFLPNDMIEHSKRKKLKLGALPCRNLPQKTAAKVVIPRKRPLLRPPPPVKPRHNEIEHLVKAFQRLPPRLQEKWSFTLRKSKLVFECYDSEHHTTPDISVCIKSDASVEYVAFCGWRVDPQKLDVCNIRFSTLYSYLGDFEKYSLCEGVVYKTQNTKLHVRHSWEENLLTSKSYHRSPACGIVCSAEGQVQRCRQCSKYDTMTEYSRKYSSKAKIPVCHDEDMVEVNEDVHGDISDLVSFELNSMNEWQKMFFKEQCQNAQKSPNARRYHPDVVRWAIEMHAKSPSAYEQLRTSGVLTLPSSTLLRQYRNFGSNEPGINELALMELDKITSPVEGYITVDEMKIKENLVFRDGQLVGFVDYGGRAAANEIATHICVFYVRSFKKEISIPLSWFPTTTTPAYQLASMFWECVAICETRKVRVNAVVADGSSVNRKFFSIIHGPSQVDLNSYIAPNPHRPERPIFICSDPSHLLKTSRNSLSSSRPGGVKYMCKSGDDILWTHVQILHQLDSKQPLHKTRLTQAHIQLNSYNKMRVGLARDTLSWIVGTSLLQDVPSSQGTAKYVLLFDKWFEIVTCRVSNPIRSVDDDRLQWLKDTFIQYFLDWENEVDTLYAGEEKRIIARPTLKGLLFTTYNIISLTKRLLQDGMEYVCLGTLTQDILEAFFGNLRSRTCRNSNPDISQVSYGVASISQRKSIKRVKGGNTTFGRKNAWTAVCDEPLPKKK